MERTHNDTPPNPDRMPQAQRKHPPEWERDLNPDHMKGQNIGAASAARETGLRTAYDVKELHDRLQDRFRDDELERVPVLPPGQRLQQGATYTDLRQPGGRECTALGSESAGPENWYVPKDEVPYMIWNRLIGESKPGQAGYGTSTEAGGG